MSLVVLEADTDSKEIKATVDGEVIENINDVNMSRFVDFDEQPQLRVTMVTETKKIGDLKTRQIVSAESQEGKKALENNKGKPIGKEKVLIEFQPSNLNAKLVQYLKQKKK